MRSTVDTALEIWQSVDFGYTFGLACGFGAMFWATARAADAIAQEMKNAVHGNSVAGAARIAGPQTSSVNRLIIPASVLAAICRRHSDLQ
jgi:hypothetical protein